jgi:hypothetical protein
MRKGVPLLLLLAGCAGAPQVHEVKEVYVCAADECGPAGRFSSGQMLEAVYRFLKANEGRDFRVCESDVKTRNCDKEGLSYFVQGGPIPGLGSTSSGALAELKADPASQAVRAKMTSNLRFIGVPLVCADHPTTISIRSADEITIVDDPYYCNWMVVGNMTASFSFAVESVDFDKGRLGGYWSHGVAGNAAGKGSGYGVLEFPVKMPAGENWLKKQ